MRVIAISGAIGWDIEPKDIRAQLDAAGTEEIEVQISSPGGLMIEGLEIFNLIKNYPGRKTTRLMGLAASMASYIVMAGDRVIAEDNAILMIHNAHACACGDHRDMRKAADIVEGMSRVVGKAYERKTGKSRAEIAALMDAETFLYGEEMVTAGFVDEIIPAPEKEEGEDKAAAIARARLAVAQCEKLVNEYEDNSTLNKAAAMIDEVIGIPQDTGVAGTKTAARAAQEEEQSMTLDQLKTEHPDVYRAAVADGITQGEKKERTRITKLQEWAASDPVCEDIVAKAIVGGQTAEDVMPQLMAAIRKGNREGQGKTGENPPQVGTGTASTGSGEGVDMDAQVKAVLAKIPKA